METKAILKNAAISARKVRLVADQVRGLSVERAVTLLEFSPKKAAHLVRKVLNSAIANAENNHAADIDELKVSTIYIDESFVAKRFRARARGRAASIMKRHCHITVKVSDGRGDK